MFSVRQAASIFYYMGVTPGRDAEKTLFADSVDGQNNPIHVDTPTLADRNYYDPLTAKDPLKVQATWAGKLWDALGFPAGSPVTKRALAGLWFGVDPNDGKTPLASKGPSVEEQVAAQKRLAEATASFDTATKRLGKLRKILSESGVNAKGIAVHAQVKEALIKIDQLKAKLRLIQHDKANRQNAHDCVFSAPKGVSIYWARLKADAMNGDQEAAKSAAALEQAIVAAARAIIEGYIEPQLVFTRSYSGNDVSFEHVKGIASALFVHFDARPSVEVSDASATPSPTAATRMPDPQMHVHALLMSMGLSHDDNVRALWTDFLGTHAKAIGAAFRGELAHRIQNMGLDIRSDRQKTVLGFSLAGIDDNQEDAFSGRRKQVVHNKSKGLTGQAAVLSQRKSKLEHTSEEMLDDWGRRIDDLNLTAESIKAAKTSDLAHHAALAAMKKMTTGKSFVDEASPRWQHMYQKQYEIQIKLLECPPPTVEEAIERLLMMKSAFTLVDISELAFGASQFCHKQLKVGQTPMQWAESFKTSILLHPSLRQIHGPDRYGRPCFTSQELLDREDLLYETNIPRLLEPRADALTAGQVEAALAQHRVAMGSKDGADFKLHDFQEAMVRDIALSPGSIHIALAPAGCGKTTAALGAVMALESVGCRVFSLAPSNKAAQKLAGELRKKPEDGMSPQKLISLIKNGKITLTSKDVLFCDEASMIGFDVAEQLVEHALAASGGPCRIVMMGDTEQLASIERGNVLGHLAGSRHFASNQGAGKSNITQVVERVGDWTRISRQRSDLGKQATAFFALGENARALDIFKRMGALRLYATREEVLDSLASDAYHPLREAAINFAECREQHSKTHNPWLPKIADLARANGDPYRESIPMERSAILAVCPAEERQSVARWFDSDAALRSARALLIEGYRDTMMIATKNADVDALNQRARTQLKTMGALGGLDGSQSITIPRGRIGSIEICEGERILFKAKASATTSEDGAEQSIANASVGTVIAVWTSKAGPMLRVQIDGQTQHVDINAKQFDQFSYAYALTAHMSQGATCSNVFEMASDFASKQTDYVSKSRYRDTHTLYAVESEFGLYEQRAKVPIEKLEAIDLSFASLMFSHLDAQMATLDGLLANGAAVDDGLAERLAQGATRRIELTEQVKAMRHRAIAQGCLIEHGEAPLDFIEGGKPSYFAKIMVGSSLRVLWGDGLRDALAAKDSHPGDYIGLEAMPRHAAEGPAQPWRAYGSEQLEQAGLRLDERGATEAARRWIKIMAGIGKGSCSPLAEGLAQGRVSLQESHDIAKATLARLNAMAAQRVEDDSRIAVIDRRAELPNDLEARIARANAALPYARQGSWDNIRQMLEYPIEVSTHEATDSLMQRLWLAQDGQLAYCMTANATIQAWSTANLSESLRATISKAAKPMADLETKRQDALDAVVTEALGPVREALAKLANKLDIGCVEHPKHGLCISIRATRTGAHRSDSQLKMLFAGDGDYGDLASTKIGGLGGVNYGLGFDETQGAWLFPIKLDGSGQPELENKQRCVNAIVEIGRAQGHSSNPAHAVMAPDRDGAWDHIQSRLGSAWGLCYFEDSKSAGAPCQPPKELLATVLPGQSADIVRWSDRVGGPDSTCEWELCSDKGPLNQDLPAGQRRLTGVVLHEDADDIFVLRGQRVVAIERERVCGKDASTPFLGQTISVNFSADGPQLESRKPSPLLSQGQLYEKDETRRKDDLAEYSRESTDVLAITVKQARTLTTPNWTPSDQCYGQAWGQAELPKLAAIRTARVSGIKASTVGAKLLETYNEPSLKLKDVQIVDVGESGVLASTKKGLWLIDTDQIKAALRFVRGKLPVLTIGMVLSEIHLNTDTSSWVRVDPKKQIQINSLLPSQ